MFEEHGKLPRVGYWLVPGKPAKQFLQKMIVDLAERFNAPVFVPHVTLYSNSPRSLQKDMAHMAGLAARGPALTMRAAGLACGEQLAQTLYVTMHNNGTANRLHQSLHSGLSQSSDYHFSPHLSLLYQDLPGTVRQRLTNQVVCDLAEIVFDEMWAVAIPDRLKQLEDFQGWQPLLIARLD